MNTTTRELLLAHGIVEYQQVLDHMTALRAAGIAVPPITLHRIRSEQTRLMWRWCWDRKEPFTRHRTADVLSEVRAWLTEHIEELDALLERKEVQLSE